MSTYTYSRTYKIFVSLFCGFFLAIGIIAEVLLFFLPVRIDEVIFLSMLFITLILACIYGLNNAFSSISLDEEGIRFKSLLYKRVFLWKGITQVNFTDNGLKLCSTASALPLQISAFRQGYAEMLALVKKPGGPKEKIKKLSIQMPTSTPKKQMVLEASKSAKLLMYLYVPGIFIALLMLITSYHFKGLAYAQFLLVLVLIYAFIHFRKTLKDNDTIIQGGLLLMLLLGVSLGLYNGPGHLFDWHPIFIISAILSLGLFLPYAVVILMANKTHIVSALIFGALLFYGCFGIVSYTNTVMDSAVGVQYRTSIMAKSMEKGGRGSLKFYITCSAWEGLVSPIKFSVSASYYYSVMEGQQIMVAVKPGALSCPWYQVVEK
ncbi:MAG: hypothetical protein JO154_25510 [Chitinophaga sp.]|uniref:hypothetical protein n=1 Tax=Chitinophaga sp. TaxID=1869181 RepID=UPI0025BCCD55|nr:hypothetical protein [Chitinophaga sp.]MBV8255978.1 hypothetical protein [Chitinophaga sp.]